MKILLPIISLVLLLGCRKDAVQSEGNSECSMTFTTSSDDQIVKPTDNQLRQALLALNVDRDGLGWAILGPSQMTYIQVSGDKKYGFVMEYQETDIKNHYRAERENFSLKEVEQAFIEYRDGTIDWSIYGKWKQITW